MSGSSSTNDVINPLLPTITPPTIVVHQTDVHRGAGAGAGGGGADNFRTKYRINRLIQKGAYGAVFEAIRLEDNEKVAMKFFGYSERAPVHSFVNDEILIMLALKNCTGAVQIQSVFYDTPEGMLKSGNIKKKQECLKETYPVIVMERALNMDILDLIKYTIDTSSSASSFTYGDIAVLFKQLMVALRSIHSKGFIHRDLKLEKILASKKDLHQAGLKIIDFGTMITNRVGESRSNDNIMSNSCGGILMNAGEHIFSSASGGGGAGRGDVMVAEESQRLQKLLRRSSDDSTDSDSDIDARTSSNIDNKTLTDSNSNSNSGSSSSSSKSSVSTKSNLYHEVNLASENKGTKELFAPEVRLGEKMAEINSKTPLKVNSNPLKGINRQFSDKSDVWQAGCCLYHMIFLQEKCFSEGFHSMDPERLASMGEEEYYSLLFSHVPEWTSIPPLLQHLFKGIFRCDPSTRLSVDQVLDHPFLNMDQLDEATRLENDLPVDQDGGIYSQKLSRILFCQKLRKYYRAVIGEEDDYFTIAKYFFYLFDTNKDKSITFHELQRGFQSLGVDDDGTTANAIADVFALIDTDNSNSIDEGEFVEFFCSYKYAPMSISHFFKEKTSHKDTTIPDVNASLAQNLRSLSDPPLSPSSSLLLLPLVGVVSVDININIDIEVSEAVSRQQEEEYTIKSFLATGGWGMVFVAKRKSRNRARDGKYVALKFFGYEGYDTDPTESSRYYKSSKPNHTAINDEISIMLALKADLLSECECCRRGQAYVSGDIHHCAGPTQIEGVFYDTPRGLLTGVAVPGFMTNIRKIHGIDQSYPVIVMETCYDKRAKAVDLNKLFTHLILDYKLLTKFLVDDNVEGRYRGKWFPGKISRDHKDGTYDVRYSDGRVALRLPQDQIEMLQTNVIDEDKEMKQTLTSPKPKPKPTYSIFARIFERVALGVKAIHTAGFIHRDLKMGNVLALSRSPDPGIRILDFGSVLATDSNNPSLPIRVSRSIIGTPGYIAPETMARSEYSQKSDVWQLGTIFWSVVYQIEKPFSGIFQDIMTGMAPSVYNGIKYESALDLYDKLFHRADYKTVWKSLLFPPDPPLSTSLANLLEGMLTLRPEDRLSLDEVLSHEFFFRNRRAMSCEDDVLSDSYRAGMSKVWLRNKLKELYRQLRPDGHNDSQFVICEYFFDFFDSNEDGVISQAELMTGVQKLLPNESRSLILSVELLFHAIDTDNNNTIEKGEFSEFFVSDHSFNSSSISTQSSTIDDFTTNNNNTNASSSTSASGGSRL